MSDLNKKLMGVWGELLQWLGIVIDKNHQWSHQINTLNSKLGWFIIIL